MSSLYSFTCLFKQIDDTHGDFRRTEVVASIVVYTLATRLAIEFVVIHTPVTQPDIGTDIYPVTHDPLVTVTETATIETAFIAVVFHLTEREIAEIIAARHVVNSEKVAFESFAQPITVFALDKPVLHLAVVLESKRIIIAA